MTATVVADVADRLLPESAFSQLRKLGHQYMLEGSAALLKVPTWSPTSTGGFISEGAAIPVSQFVFSANTLTAKKAASVLAVDDELLAFAAAGDVEATMRTIMSESIGLMIDGILLGSASATSAAPAGLLAGLTPITASVLTPATAAMVADLKALIAATSPVTRPVLITGPVQAATLAVLAPSSTVAVIVAPTLAAGQVIAVDAAAFASALGVPAFRASQNATLHMENTLPLPIVGGTAQPPVIASVGAPVRSSFQTDVVALRSIIPCDWLLRRTGAVAVVNSVTW